MLFWGKLCGAKSTYGVHGIRKTGPFSLFDFVIVIVFLYFLYWALLFFFLFLFFWEIPFVRAFTTCFSQCMPVPTSACQSSAPSEGVGAVEYL